VEEYKITNATINLQQTKQYKLDWNKVETIHDIKLLLQLIHNVKGDVTLYLYDEMVDDYKHLFTEESE
jgi:hypothetical protein